MSLYHYNIASRAKTSDPDHPDFLDQIIKDIEVLAPSVNTHTCNEGCYKVCDTYHLMESLSMLLRACAESTIKGCLQVGIYITD
jgi:hypothetical protein